VGLETEICESLFKHGAISNAAVGDKKNVFVVLTKIVEGINSSLDFLRSAPLI